MPAFSKHATDLSDEAKALLNEARSNYQSSKTLESYTTLVRLFFKLEMLGNELGGLLYAVRGPMPNYPETKHKPIYEDELPSRSAPKSELQKISDGIDNILEFVEDKQDIDRKISKLLTILEQSDKHGKGGYLLHVKCATAGACSWREGTPAGGQPKQDPTQQGKGNKPAHELQGLMQASRSFRDATPDTMYVDDTFPTVQPHAGGAASELHEKEADTMAALQDDQAPVNPQLQGYNTSAVSRSYQKTKTKIRSLVSGSSEEELRIFSRDVLDEQLEKMEHEHATAALAAERKHHLDTLPRTFQANTKNNLKKDKRTVTAPAAKAPAAPTAPVALRQCPYADEDWDPQEDGLPSFPCSAGPPTEDLSDEPPYIREITFVLKKALTLKFDPDCADSKVQQYVAQAASMRAVIERTMDQIHANHEKHTVRTSGSRFAAVENFLQDPKLRLQDKNPAGRRAIQNFVSTLSSALLAAIRYAHPDAEALFEHGEQGAKEFVHVLSPSGRNFVTYFRELAIMLQIYGPQSTQDFRTHPLAKLLLSCESRTDCVEVDQLIGAWMRCTAILIMPEDAEDYDESVVKLSECCPYEAFFLYQGQDLFDATPASLQELLSTDFIDPDILTFPFPRDGSQKATVAWTDACKNYILEPYAPKPTEVDSTKAGPSETPKTCVEAEQQKLAHAEKATPSKRRSLSADGADAKEAAGASKAKTKRGASTKSSATKKNAASASKKDKQEVLAKSSADVLRMQGKGLMPPESTIGKGRAAAEHVTRVTQDHTLQNILTSTVKQRPEFPVHNRDFTQAYAQKRAEFAPETEATISNAKDADLIDYTDEQLQEAPRELQQFNNVIADEKPPMASPPPHPKSTPGAPKPVPSPLNTGTFSLQAESRADIEEELSHRMMSRGSLREELEERRRRAQQPRASTYTRPADREPDFRLTSLKGGSGLDGFRENRFQPPNLPDEEEQAQIDEQLRREQMELLKARVEELRRKKKEFEETKTRREQEQAQRDHDRREQQRRRDEHQRMPMGPVHSFFDMLHSFGSSGGGFVTRNALPRRRESTSGCLSDPLAGMASTKHPEGRKTKQEILHDYECYLEEPTAGAHNLPYNSKEHIPAHIWLKVAAVQDSKTKGYFQNPRPSREARRIVSDYFTRKSQQKIELGDLIAEPLPPKALYICTLKSTQFWVIDQFDEDRVDDAVEEVVCICMNGLGTTESLDDAIDRYAIDGKLESKESTIIVPAGPTIRPRVWKAYLALVRDAATQSAENYTRLRLKDRNSFSSIRAILNKCLKDVRTCSFSRGHDPTTALPANFEKAVAEFRQKGLFFASCYITGFFRSSPELMNTRHTALHNRFQQGEGKWWKEMEEKDPAKLLQTNLDRLDNYANRSCQVHELELDYNSWAGLVPAITKTQQLQIKGRQMKKQKEREDEKKKLQHLGGNGGNGGNGRQNQNDTKSKNQWKGWNNNRDWKKRGWRGWWDNSDRDRGGGGGGSTFSFGNTAPTADKRTGDQGQGGQKRQRTNDGGARPGAVEVNFIREKVAAAKVVTTEEIKGHKEICCYYLGTLAGLKDDNDREVRCLSHPNCAKCGLVQMGRLEASHKGALEKLRAKNLREKRESEDAVYEAERVRLHAWLQEQRDRKETERALAEQQECLDFQMGIGGPRPWDRPSTHIYNISTAYLGHDTEFQTQRLSPFLLKEWANDVGHLSPEMREEVYGKAGHVNRGFPVEGPVPLYGAWPNARKLTTHERTRLMKTKQELEHRLSAVGQLLKLRSEPYLFEDQQILDGCWSAVSKLLDGPWADRLDPSEIEGKDEWIFPYFGIGQKWIEEEGRWAKIRPIANEKARNRLCSPITERMTLPGTDAIVDFVMYAASPTIADSMTQTKTDISESIARNRKKKGGEKMTWMNIDTLPQPLPGYQGHAFTPVFGKLDLFQAYLQLGVSNPDRNIFQLFSPEKREYVYGKSYALSFGNIHSVFGFVASISELISKVINDLMEIPAAVYIDDIIFCATPRLQQLYMDAIREMLAIAGIAVAPEKCEVAPLGEPLEILGIIFHVYEDRVEVYLSRKKISTIVGRIRRVIDLTGPLLSKKIDRGKYDFDNLYEELEKVNGLFIHATYWRNVKRGVPLARFVYNLLGNKNGFEEKTTSEGCVRSLRLMLTNMEEETQLQKPMIIRQSVAIRKRIHVMTDASAKGVDVAFGGLVFREDGSSIGYSLHTTQAELPPNLRRASILVYELIAIKIAQIVFKEEHKDASIVQHCDNAGAVYGLAKGALTCSLATSIVTDIGNTNIDREDLTYCAYINTHANPSDACTRTDMMEALARTYGTKFTIPEDRVREILLEIANDSQLEAELNKNGRKQKKTGNKYSGALPQFRLEIQENLREDPKRPKAENIVPREVSKRWPITDAQVLFVWPEESAHLGTDKGIPIRNSKWRVWMLYTIKYLPGAFFGPDSIRTREQYEALRANHPNVLWAQLQIFGQWLYEKEIQTPKAYVALVAQRLRSLNALERTNPQSCHLQTLTFKALETYGERFEPCRAMPPDIDKVNRLTRREQVLFNIWMSTGLRKESMISMREDLIQVVTPMKRFAQALIPSIKSVPVPGETFAVFFPAALFSEGLFPVEATELDRIAHTLGTTSHGIRRALAIYLRRRAAEIGAYPGTQEYAIFRKRVCNHFAWTLNSVMWEDVHSLDVIKYVNTKFMVRPDVDAWFTTELY
eukprot:g12689.t1